MHDRNITLTEIRQQCYGIFPVEMYEVSSKYAVHSVYYTRLTSSTTTIADCLKRYRYSAIGPQHCIFLDGFRQLIAKQKQDFLYKE